MDRRKFIVKSGLAGAGIYLFGQFIRLANSLEEKLSSEDKLVKVSYEYKAPYLVHSATPEDKKAILKQSIAERDEMIKLLIEGGTIVIDEEAIIKRVVDRKLEAVIDKFNAYESRQDKNFGLLRRSDGSYGENIAMHTIVDKDPFLQKLCEYVTRGCKTKEEMAQALLCFVQTGIKSEKLSYEVVKEPFLFEDQKEGATNRIWFGQDGVRNPYKTLIDKAGDCKDKSVLYMSLLFQLDIPNILIIYQPKKGILGHVNVGVAGNFDEKAHINYYINYGGTPYYLSETTIQAPAKIGHMLNSLKENFKLDKFELQDPSSHQKARKTE